MKRISWIVGLVLALGPGMVSAGADDLVKIVDLGSLGGTRGAGLLINNSRMVVGTSRNSHPDINEGRYDHFVVWRSGLPTLFDADELAYPKAINNQGTVVGGSYFGDATLFKNGTHYYILGGGWASFSSVNIHDASVGGNGYSAIYWDWTVGNDYQRLPTRANTNMSEASSINDWEEIVGAVQLQSDSKFYSAFWLNHLSKPTVLESLPNSHARSINNARQIVGDCVDSSGNVSLFLWNGKKAPTVIPGPPGSNMGGSYFADMHINDQGTVCFNLFPVDSDGNHLSDPIPYVWTSAGGYQNLSAKFKSIGSINDHGDMVGTDNFDQPVVWHNGSVTYLQSLGSGLTNSTAINNRGDVAGLSNAMQAGRDHGFLWNSESGITDLFAPLSPFATGGAFALNDNGQVVGRFKLDVFPYSSVYTGFVWDSVAGLKPLPSFDGAIYPYAINNSGWITGGAVRSDGTYTAFVFNPSTNASFDIFAGMDSGDSFGSSINESGVIAGTFLSADYTYHGFTYDTATGSFIDIGDIGGGGFTGVTSINNRGQLSILTYDEVGDAHVLLYSSADRIEDLGNLGLPYITSTGMNDFGQVVGDATIIKGYFYYDSAFVAGPGSTMIDLNTVKGGQKWTLLQASGINNNGQISGSGFHNGESRAFRITPIAKLGSISVSPITVTKNGTVTGKVVLTQTAPYDLYVKLSASSSAVTVPPFVKVPGGSSTATFTVTAGIVTKPTAVNIVGTFAGKTVQAKLTVKP